MKLDLKDTKILQELDINPRIRVSKLAKKVRLSQQVVDYRIRKLQENEVITHFGTIINLSKMGYKQYRTLFQFNNITEEVKHKLINYLTGHNKVYWAAIIGSKWDLFVVVFVENYEEFENFLDKLFNKFPNVLKDYEALNVLYHEFYNHKFLQLDKTPFTIKMDLASNKLINLDKIDLCILSQIKANSRLSSLEIAKKCDVSYKTIQNRIKNLERDNIISGYRVFLRSEKYNYKAYLLLISFYSYGRDVEKKMLNYARNNEFITQATKLFGRWSLLFHIRIKNERELQNLIIEIRNKYSIIGDYEIIPIFEDISIDHFPMSKTLK